MRGKLWRSPVLINKTTEFAAGTLTVGVSVLTILAVLNHARMLYLRTRLRWPHAKLLWLLYPVSITFLTCTFAIAGMTAISFMGSPITTDDSSYWPPIWVAVGFGVVGSVVAIVDALAIAVEIRRYGRL